MLLDNLRTTHNYPTHDLEMAADVFAMKNWRHYCMGRHVRFTQTTQELEVYLPTKGLHQQIEIRKWKWEKITMDFVTGPLLMHLDMLIH